MKPNLPLIASLEFVSPVVAKLSDIVRSLNYKIPLREETRAFYDQLADHKAGFEKMRNNWLETVAPTADKMPFIAVDPSEIVKPYGKDFDYLSIIRDASDPSKRLIARKRAV